MTKGHRVECGVVAEIVDVVGNLRAGLELYAVTDDFLLRPDGRREAHFKISLHGRVCVNIARGVNNIEQHGQAVKGGFVSWCMST